MTGFSPESTAFLFPGQGSQTLGMGQELTHAFPAAKLTFEEADEILHFPLSKTAWEGPERELNDTINTQPALLVHSIACLRVFQLTFPGFIPAFVAGHSMGEISALVASGAASFSEALTLARKRGELMKQAGEHSPGGMAAILGLDIPSLEKICTEARTANEPVQVANDNSPGQVVISGAKPALERAISLAQQSGARRAVFLAVSIAAHSELMIHAQEAFNEAVKVLSMYNPAPPIIGNVTASPLLSSDEIRSDLCAQLTSRVRWTESIRFMISRGVNTFIELGNGNVLTGLLKRIDPQVTGIPLGAPQDFNILV